MEAEARLILAAAVEAVDEPVDLVASIRQHFAGTGLQLELPDRKSAMQRPITFGS
jgi:plasmid stability protein